MEGVTTQNFCKFKPRMDWIMDVQLEVEGFKTEVSRQGEVE